MTVSKLYVGNLSYSTSEESLKELFSSYGNVTSVNIISGRGFGFVEMETPEAAASAKEALNGTEFDGRTIKVDNAKPRKDFNRNNYRGGKRSGFRRHSR